MSTKPNQAIPESSVGRRTETEWEFVLQFLWRTLDFKARSSSLSLAPTSLATIVQLVQEVPTDKCERPQESPALLPALPLPSLHLQGGECWEWQAVWEGLHLLGCLSFLQHQIDEIQSTENLKPVSGRSCQPTPGGVLLLRSTPAGNTRSYGGSPPPPPHLAHQGSVLRMGVKTSFWGKVWNCLTLLSTWIGIFLGHLA